MDFYIYMTSETIKGLEKKVNEKHKEGYIKKLFPSAWLIISR